jgi:hypothetical protein
MTFFDTTPEPMDALTATRVMPTPVLIIRRQPTGWTRPGLFTGALSGGRP